MKLVKFVALETPKRNFQSHPNIDGLADLLHQGFARIFSLDVYWTNFTPRGYIFLCADHPQDVRTSWHLWAEQI